MLFTPILSGIEITNLLCDLLEMLGNYSTRRTPIVLCLNVHRRWESFIRAAADDALNARCFTLRYTHAGASLQCLRSARSRFSSFASPFFK